MNQKLKEIREYIHSEITKSTKCDPWFWDEHILIVERLAKDLLKKHPEANEETVLLSVWLHDLGRAYGHDEDHDVWSATFAQTFLMEKGFDERIVGGVSHACYTHSADERMPEALEAKILATADALSHFDGGFYLRIFFAWKDE